jgi:hypothetical protein
MTSQRLGHLYSQILDSVHSILRKQLVAVEEAREIQRRLHDTS